jgi:hypothetical protein
MNDFDNKIIVFAATVEADQLQRLAEQKLDCQANINGSKTVVKGGNKYVKVDIGTCGRFIVEKITGNIFEIKAYGQIHRGHQYGTLDTVNEWYWGNYYPQKR